MSGLTNTQQKASRPCPCGCGKALHPYDERLPLVCTEVWRQAPAKSRRLLLLGGVEVTDRERQEATKAVLDTAARLKAEREAASPEARPHTHRTTKLFLKPFCEPRIPIKVPADRQASHGSEWTGSGTLMRSVSRAHHSFTDSDSHTTKRK